MVKGVCSLVGLANAWIHIAHCVRERETDSSGLWDNPLRLEFLAKQVGEFASSGKVAPCGEERTRVFPGVAFEILLPLGGGLAAQLIVYQWLFQTCEASGGAVEDHPRGRRGGSCVLQ